MKKLKYIFTLLGASAIILSCEKVAPDPGATNDCDQNHTATVVFTNKSVSHRTFNIIWDGSSYATIAPGESKTIKASAGGHTLAWKISNTSTYGCTQSNPVLIQCYTHNYSCSY